MSFAWLKLANDFADHIKTQNLCDELGDENAGMYLVRLWSWANKNCPTGLVSAVNRVATIERVCHWSGEKGRLVKAMVSSGWLDEEDTGLYLHDWHDHQGKRIVAAEKDAKGAKERRTSARRPTVGDSSCERREEIVSASADRRENVGDSSCASLRLTSTSQVVVASSSGGSGGPALVEAPAKPEADWLGEDFWRWAQAKRQKAGLVPERFPRHEKLSSWWSSVRMVVPEVEALKDGFYKFGDDKFWQSKDPALPFAGFMSQWEKYTQMGVRHAGA